MRVVVVMAMRMIRGRKKRFPAIDSWLLYIALFWALLLLALPLPLEGTTNYTPRNAQHNDILSNTPHNEVPSNTQHNDTSSNTYHDDTANNTPLNDTPNNTPYNATPSQISTKTSTKIQRSIETKSSIKPTQTESISLNFQDIEIRSVLQILADFTGFNLIASDTVQGNITLRLENIPWDQALELILKSKGLDKRQLGKVMMVGPIEELNLREKQELERQKQTEDLGPLHSEVIQINYAKAEDLAIILKEKGNSLLTFRGNVTVDRRTNTLLVQDVENKLKEVKLLIKNLDVPIRQVEIHTQIITADNTLEDALGVHFAGGSAKPLGILNLSPGNITGSSNIVSNNNGNTHGSINGNTNSNTSRNSHNQRSGIQEGLFSDLSSTLTGGGLARLGLALSRLPGNILLDLELQALEFESKIKTIARPTLTTVDQNKAYVEAGVEIPYQESTKGGGASVAFKKAVLRLEVTPQITANNKILLDLMISNDSQGNITTQNTGTGATSQAVGINTNKLQTKVLADNGETIVLGGVITLTDANIKAKVPVLSNVPVLGLLFRNRYQKDNCKELLIFITAKIVMPQTSQ